MHLHSLGHMTYMVRVTLAAAVYHSNASRKTIRDLSPMLPLAIIPISDVSWSYPYLFQCWPIFYNQN